MVSAQYIAAFKVLVALSGIKSGDMVKLISAPTTHYGNDPEHFDPEDMRDAKDYIGETFEVDYVSNDQTVYINNDQECVYLHVPIWCLVKDGSTEVELNDEYTAILSADGTKVQVGCQSIPAAAVLKLATAIAAATKPAVKKLVAKKATKKVAKKTTARRAPCF